MKFDAEDLGFIISKKMKMGKKDAQKMLIKMMTIMTLLIGFGLAFSINDIKVHLTGIETIGTVTHISVKVDEEDGSKTYQPTFNYHC